MQLSQRKELILNGNTLKALITLAIPLMIGNIIQTLYNLADAFWVGRLGSLEFSAINFVFPIMMTFIALSIGMAVAATSIIGQAIGSNDLDKANKVAGQFFTISLIAGIVFAIIGAILTPQIVSWMGAEGKLHEYSTRYLRIVFFQMPLLFLFHVFKAMREGQGDTMTPTILLGISVILNIVLDPLFILTFGWGIEGAAYATVLSRFVIFWYMLYSMLKNKLGVYLKKEYLKLDLPILRNLMVIAIPASLGQAVSSIGFAVMNGFVESYGEDTLAAFALGNRITSLFMMPAFGIAGALAAFIGQNIGASHYIRAKKAVYKAILSGFSLLVVGSIILYFVKLPIARLFIIDSDVVLDLSLNYMNVLCFVFPLMAIFQGFIGTFQGSGHTRYVLSLSVIRLWLLRIPMIVLFKAYTTWGSNGVWYAMLISNIIVCMLGYMIFLQGNWLNKTIVDKYSFE